MRVQYTTVAYGDRYRKERFVNNEWYAISLDDFVIEAFDALGRDHDSPASHYAAFHCGREEAIDRFVATVRRLTEKMMYKSTDYGYPEGEE